MALPVNIDLAGASTLTLLTDDAGDGFAGWNSNLFAGLQAFYRHAGLALLIKPQRGGRQQTTQPAPAGFVAMAYPHLQVTSGQQEKSNHGTRCKKQA